MRVAFDHQIFGWQEYGGISRYAYELASKLSTSFEQDVAIVSPIYVTKYLANAPQQLKIFGLHVPAFKRSGRIYRAVNSLFAQQVISQFRPDIVHETYYAVKGVAPKNARVVVTVHDMIHERFPEFFSQVSPTRREKAIAVARADHVICVSEQTRRDLIEILDVPPEKTTVVYHGLSLSVDPRIIGKNKSLERPYLLYVGSRTGHKNFIGFLRAYASSKFLKNEFDVICFGGGGFSAREREIIKELSIADGRVRQISGNDELLGSSYRNARAFVYPSLYEGFGIPPLEAMSFGCPVVCSNVSSIPEVVGDAAVKFDPENQQAMKAAIESVAENDEVCASLVEKGNSRAGFFSWEQCARNTLDVYQKLNS